MAYKSFNNLWESEFYNFVSEKDKVQDKKINQLKLEVHDTFKKGEKVTDFKPISNEDLMNKA